MFKALFEKMRAHFLVKLGIGLFLTTGAGIELLMAYRYGTGDWAAAMPMLAELGAMVAVSVIVFGRRASAALRDVEQALVKLAGGVTDIRLSGMGRTDEIGRLSAATLLLRDAVRSLHEAKNTAQSALVEKSRWLDLLPVGFLAVQDGIIVECNGASEKILGWTTAELVGTPLRTLCADQHGYEELLQECRRVREANPPYSWKTGLRRKNGEKFWAELSCDSNPNDNDASGVWTLRDISQAKLAEADILERVFRLETLVAERTCQLEEARQVAAQAYSETRANESGLLDQIDAVPFDPVNAVLAIATLFALRVDNSGREIVLDIAPGLPHLLLGSPLRISQALGDLLNHAVRSSSQGEIIVSVRERGRSDQKAQLQFSVQSVDSGLFESKNAPEADARDGHDGETIRSLVIAEQAAERMGGKLKIEGRAARGGTLQFAAEFDLVSPALDRVSIYVAKLRDYEGRRVMVIDDNRSARQAAASMLASLGFVPMIFESGASALDSLCRPGAPHYAFICIDQCMPGLDGASVVRHLQAHYGRACPPLLLMAAARKAPGGQAGMHGLAATVSKPLTTERLFAAIAGMLPIATSGQGEARQPLLKGKRILLLCRGSMLREITADVLRGAGAAVQTAIDGIEVLQAVREQLPDCVLMDCRLSAVGGPEISGQLRALGYANLPVIGMVPGNRPAGHAICKAAGMNDFVTNPVNAPELLAVLGKWTGRPKHGIQTEDLAALPPLPPELDVAAGLRHLRGKTALFLKALRMFRDNCGQQFQLEFRLAVKAGDWQTSERLAHSLKDTAATIGARHVSVAAARLEAAIRASNYEDANVLLAELTEKLRILVEGLAHIG